MTGTVTQPKERSKKSSGMPPYNVILLNDDDHSFDYVILMLADIFGHPPEKGFDLALEVDKSGHVIVNTTNLELAELKRERIQTFGPDPLIPRCKGSMSAVVEPATG